MKAFNFFLNILLIIFLVVFQLGFLSYFRFLSNLNLILCFVIFLSLFEAGSFLFLWVFLGGFLLGFYNIFPLGTHIFIFLTIAFILQYLLRDFLSHRSIYSLIVLIIIGIFLYNSGLLILSHFFYWIKLANSYIALDGIYFINFLQQIVLNTMVTIFIILTSKFWQKI